MASQPWHYWHFGLDNSWLWKAVLCIAGCLAANLTSTTKLQKMSPNITRCPLWGGAKLPLVESHWFNPILSVKLNFSLVSLFAFLLICYAHCKLGSDGSFLHLGKFSSLAHMCKCYSSFIFFCLNSSTDIIKICYGPYLWMQFFHHQQWTNVF